MKIFHSPGSRDTNPRTMKKKCDREKGKRSEGRKEGMSHVARIGLDVGWRISVIGLFGYQSGWTISDFPVLDG